MLDYKTVETSLNFEDKPFDYIEFRVDSWKRWFGETMAELDKVNSKEIRLLTYFSILDMLSQEYFNYPTRRAQKHFADFVLKFQNKYDFLELTDPITLYYRMEQDVKGKINLDDIEDGGIYYPKSEVIRNKTVEILKEIEESKGSNVSNNKKREHRYVDLLYRMRCRLSHEFSAPHMSHNRRETNPYYINCYRQYVAGNELVSDNVWQLLFPVQFIKELCVNCFENYLLYCVEEQIPPDQNNGLDRFCELSWYNI